MIRKLFSPFGRLSRGGMWLWGVLIFGVFAIATFYADYLFFDINIFDPELDEEYNNLTNLTYFSNVYFWLTLWPMTVLSIKRFHDVGLSGWWYVSFYVLWLAFDEVLILRSTGDLSSTLSYFVTRMNFDIHSLVNLV